MPQLSGKESSFIRMTNAVRTCDAVQLRLSSQIGENMAK
jgi:hypothetical protein